MPCCLPPAGLPCFKVNTSHAKQPRNCGGDSVRQVTCDITSGRLFANRFVYTFFPVLFCCIPLLLLVYLEINFGKDIGHRVEDLSVLSILSISMLMSMSISVSVSMSNISMSISMANVNNEVRNVV